MDYKVGEGDDVVSETSHRKAETSEVQLKYTLQMICILNGNYYSGSDYKSYLFFLQLGIESQALK